MSRTDGGFHHAKPVYKRVLLKISGEALAGDKKSGLDFGVISSVCEAVKKCLALGVEVGIVIGGGTLPGTSAPARVRPRERRPDGDAGHDHQLAGPAVGPRGQRRESESPHLDPDGTHRRVYSKAKALDYLEAGYVVIIGGGTSNPISRPTLHRRCAASSSKPTSCSRVRA